ncbi:MAG TPA: hypothetical protein PLV87_08325, partial [Opitutaceae bacterium]|nr:hypothetical protein [Opitutaceae bacterium]
MGEENTGRSVGRGWGIGGLILGGALLGQVVARADQIQELPVVSVDVFHVANTEPGSTFSTPVTALR